jgi:hypothetical protein
MDYLIHEGFQMWFFSLSAVFSGMALEYYTHWLFKFNTWLKNVDARHRIPSGNHIRFSVRTVSGLQYDCLRVEIIVDGRMPELSAMLAHAMNEDDRAAETIVNAICFYAAKRDLDFSGMVEHYKRQYNNKKK